MWTLEVKGGEPNDSLDFCSKQENVSELGNDIFLGS